MKIEDCKSIVDYLRMCNAQTVDDLTDDQLLAWAKSGKMGLNTKNSVSIVEYGMFGELPNKKRAIMLLRQAIKEQKEFFCSYVEDESCEKPDETQEGGHEYFVMRIR